MDFKELRVKDVRTVVRYRPRVRKWTAKNRSDHIVGIQLCGSSLHDFEYQKFTLSGNCIFFFNRRDSYSVETLDAGEAFSIHFTTYEEIDTDSFCIPISNPSEIISILDRAESAKNEENHLLLLSQLYRLCAELERIREKSYFKKDKRILSAKSYIDANFKDADCLAKAIKQSSISARRFNDLFKGLFDTTPSRYLTERRIDRAKSLLQTQSVTVGEVSRLCGFSDVYYFSKVFKQVCGVSPSKWK